MTLNDKRKRAHDKLAAHARGAVGPPAGDAGQC